MHNVTNITTNDKVILVTFNEDLEWVGEMFHKSDRGIKKRPKNTNLYSVFQWIRR